MKRLMCMVRHRGWQGLALIVAALMLSSCGWRGISNVQIPGGPGTGAGSYTVYVQMPDTLSIDGNSKVMVADVFVGSIRKIELKNWVATLTLDVQPGLNLPSNTMAAAEKWAAGLGGPAYAIDDQTAIKVVDGRVEVVSEGHWRFFARRA